VIRADSFNGSGKVRAWMRRHSVDLYIGTKASTWGCGLKPVYGNPGAGRVGWGATIVVAGMEIVLGMIWPRRGLCRRKT
jgi:hypothetical protein